MRAKERMNIAADLTELIGHTPLLRLDRFAAGTEATVLAKLELMNPYSVKDREVRSMIEGAEARGELRPGAIRAFLGAVAVAA